MLYKIWGFTKQWWDGFWYNFGWSDWVHYIDGWIPRFSLFVPVVGYLIIFNDRIGGSIAFQSLLGIPLHTSLPVCRRLLI